MLNFLTTPVLYIIISFLSTGGIGLLIKACHDSAAYDHLQKQYTETLESLSNCQTRQAVIESNLKQQQQALTRYTASQERYRLNSITKYEAQHEKNKPQPCEFDFTFANELLKAQGTRRLQ